MRKLAFAALTLSGALASLGADAAKPPHEALQHGSPGLLQRLVDCRTIADNKARLA